MGYLQSIVGIFARKSQQVAKNKTLIRSVIGNEYSVVKPLEFLGGFHSGHQLFKRFPNNYAAVMRKSRTGVTGGENYSHYIALKYDKNRIMQIRIFDTHYKDVGIYDRFGYLVKHYSPEETEALQLYKHDSKKFHQVLRYNKPIKDEKLIREKANIISDIFKFNYKVNRAEKDFTVYRALDNKALKTILSMPENGMVYVEPSILSVATKKRSILQFMKFKNYNHILRLKVKKGTPYINLDEVSAGCIVIPQGNENELILKQGTKFLVTNRKAKGGFIDAEIIE